MSEISYQFEMNPNKKGKCPACGHENCFNYYEKNGLRLNENFGRCSRVKECGYMKIPDTDIPSALNNLPAPNKDEINSYSQSSKEVSLQHAFLRPSEICKKMGWSRSRFKCAGMFRTIKKGNIIFVIVADLNTPQRLF